MISSRFHFRGRRIIGTAVLLAGCIAGNARAEDHTDHGDCLNAANASHHHHHDAGASEGFLAPAKGTRWSTDEPLRAGMTRIRDAVTTVLAGHARGTLQAKDAKDLQQTLNTQFAFMAEHCRLAPDADAALHVIIVRLMEASAHLAEKPGDVPAAALLRKALNHYGATFDHPNWSPVPE